MQSQQGSAQRRAETCFYKDSHARFDQSLGFEKSEI